MKARCVALTLAAAAEICCAGVQAEPISIVEFKLDGRGSATALDPKELPSAVAENASRVVDRLLQHTASTRDDLIVREYSHLPLLAVRARPETLSALVSQGILVASWPDVAHAHALNDTFGLVGSERVIRSTGHLESSSRDWRGINGRNTVIAVLDDGVDGQHAAFYEVPDAGAKVPVILEEACYSVASSNSACPGNAATAFGPGSSCNRDPYFCNHGTHVAGIAMGRGLGSGSYRGISQSELISINVFHKTPGRPEATTANILAGINYVVARSDTRNNIVAVNMSFGSQLYSAPCTSSPYRTAFQTLVARNIAPVVATGNDGLAGQINSPSCVPEAVSVASSTKNDDISDFSNFSSFTTLVAPGSFINSADAYSDHLYIGKSGTSMAAPHVAGAIAVLREALPSTPLANLIAQMKLEGTAIVHSGLIFKRIDIFSVLASRLLPFPRLVRDVGPNSSLPSYPLNSRRRVYHDLNAIRIVDETVPFSQVVFSGPACGIPIISLDGTTVAAPCTDGWGIQGQVIYGRVTGSTGTMQSVPGTFAMPSPSIRLGGLSSNGRWLAFDHSGTVSASNPSFSASGVFLFDTQAQTVLGAGMGPSGQLMAECRNSSLSSDGRWLAYSCESTGERQIFIRDIPTGVVTLFGSGDQPILCGRAGTVNFVRTANNGFRQIYQSKAPSFETVLVSQGSGGTPGNNHSQFPTSNFDCSVIGFNSLATNFSGSPQTSRQSVYVNVRSGANSFSSSAVNVCKSSEGNLPATETCSGIRLSPMADRYSFYTTDARVYLQAPIFPGVGLEFRSESDHILTDGWE